MNEHRDAYTDGLRFFKRFREFILGILSLLAAISAGMLLIRQNTGLLFLFLLAFAVTLWLFSIVIYFRQTKVKNVLLPARAASGPLVRRKSAYSKRERLAALVLIIAVPSLFVMSLGIRKYRRAQNTSKVLILIAEFEGPDPEKYDVTRIINDQLEEATRSYPEVIFRRLGNPIRSNSDREATTEARRLGYDENAKIVLWGRYSVNEENVRVTIHFEILDKLQELPFRKTKETLISPVADLQSFTIQEGLSRQMTYLTLLTVGILRLKALDLDGAIARFTDALSHTPAPENMVDPALVFYHRGTALMLKAFLSKSSFDPAIADFNRVVDVEPFKVTALTNRAVLYYEKGQIEASLKDLNEVLGLDANFAVGYINRGNAYLALGRSEQAIADYIQASKLNNHWVAYNNLGNAYRLANNLDQALMAVDKAIVLNPKAFRAYATRGFIYRDRRQYNRAIQDFTQSITLNPEYYVTYHDRGKVYTQVGKWSLANADFNQAIALNPSDPGPYISLGNSLLRIGQRKLAIATFEKAFGLKLTKAADYYARAVSFASSGQTQYAIADFQEAINLDGTFAMAYLGLAVEYLAMKRFDLALQNCEAALKVEPSFMAYLQRAMTLEEMGNYDGAIENYSLAIIWKPRATGDYALLIEGLELDEGSLYYFRAKVYNQNRDFPHVIADCSTIISLRSKDRNRALMLRASAYSDIRKFDDAISDYSQVITAEPNNADAFANRAAVYLEKGEPRSAISDCNEAIKLKPDHSVAFLNRSGAYLALSQFEEAINDANYAIKLNPNYDLAYNNRAGIYIKMKNYDKSVSDLKRVIELTKNFALRKNAEAELRRMKIK